MIFVQGLRSPLSLVRTSSLSPSLTSHWCFWQSQKKLTKSAQRAVWATQIIKTIEQSEPPKSIAQPSLRQRILKLEVTSQDYALEPECKNDVLQLFEGGIFLNPKVFDQGRLFQAEQPKLNQEINKQLNAKTIFSRDQGTYIFCPNSLVTKHIFNYMGRNQTNNFFISGGYGISKTISIILYLHLSNFITTYFCEASRPNSSATQGQDQEANVNKAEEMQDLQRKQLLREKAYKYFYWGIRSKHYKIQDFIKTLVLEQAHQLSSKERQTLAGYDDFSMRLQQFYPPNVQVRSIVDQINTLESQLRRCNNEKQKIDKMEARKQKKYDQLLFELNFLQAKILTNYLKQFKKVGKWFGVSSSAEIKRQLLKTSYEKNGLLSLGLEDQQLLTYYRVPYQRAISSPEGANEFKQFIWFEIERKLLFNKTDDIKMFSLKKKFNEEIEGKSIPGFANFFTVSRLFDRNQVFVNLQDDRHEQEFMKKSKRIIQSFEWRALEDEKNIFEGLFFQCTEQETLVIERLYQLAKSRVLNATKRHQLFQFNNKQLEADSRLINYNLSERLLQRNRNTSEFQEKMPYELLENGMIRLPWTIQEFIIISQKYFQPQVEREFKLNISKFDSEFLSRYEDVKQMFFKSLLRQCLQKSRTIAHIRLFTEQVNNKKNRRFYGGEKIEVKHVTKFLHFSKKSRQNFIDHNLQQLLDISRKNPGEACVAIPHYIDKKGNYFVSDKSKIDFIICKYGPKNGFHITTYDTTVLGYQVASKQENHPIFYKEHIFHNMKKFKIPAANFNFRHVILCPWEYCKLPQVKSIDGLIRFHMGTH